METSRSEFGLDRAPMTALRGRGFFDPAPVFEPEREPVELLPRERRERPPAPAAVCCAAPGALAVSAAATIDALTTGGVGVRASRSTARSTALLPNAFSLAARASRSSARLRSFSLTTFQLGRVAEPGVEGEPRTAVESAEEDERECGPETGCDTEPVREIFCPFWARGGLSGARTLLDSGIVICRRGWCRLRLTAASSSSELESSELLDAAAAAAGGGAIFLAESAAANTPFDPLARADWGVTTIRPGGAPRAVPAAAAAAAAGEAEAGELCGENAGEFVEIGAKAGGA